MCCECVGSCITALKARCLYVCVHVCACVCMSVAIYRAKSMVCMKVSIAREHINQRRHSNTITHVSVYACVYMKEKKVLFSSMYL